ncbi:MAG: caspase family protein [Sphingobacteriales bacterium]|jgi:hypothetical protein|nr:MAG: caspase family protein [Sphingobacteriales bacterium]
MKNLIVLILLSFFLTNQYTTNAQEPVTKKIVLCESYSSSGVPSGINANWEISSTGGYVYILYTNGSSSIKTNNTLWLYIDKYYEDTKKYGAYATEKFTVKSGDKFSVYDYKFTEAGDYKIMAYQDGKTLATTYTNISIKNNSTTTTTKTNDASITFCQSSDDYGNPSGVYSVWNITDEANLVNILFKNGNSTINKNSTLYLYVDKKDKGNDYVAYGTEKFDVKSGSKFSNFFFPFKDPGEYKVSAVQNTEYLATSYVTIQKNGSSETSKSSYNSNNSSQKIVTCSDYNLTTGVPSGVYETWDIKQGGGYVYVVYNNGTKMSGTYWLYVDKYDEDEDDYVAFDTKTFETNNKSWSAYKYTFTEGGKYKISAVNSKGEQASSIVTVNFADGVVVDTKKSISLCESYDDYGKPIGINTVWNIENNSKGGWVYVLYDNGSKMNKTTLLYVDKKNTTGKYVAYDTKTFENNGKNWSVFDYNFKETGEYKLSAAIDGSEVASVYATIKYKTTKTNEPSKYQEDITTWYYDGSEAYFSETASSTSSKISSYTIPSTGKKLTLVYKQNKEIKTNKVIVDIWTGTDYADFVETKEFVTLPAQKTIYMDYTFKKAGKYKFSVYNQDEIFMNLAEVEIKTTSTNTYTNTTTNTPKTNTTTTTNNNASNNNNNQNSIYNSLSFNNSNSNESRTALVIGNGNYVSAGKLPNPAHDAEEMAKSLQACGFKVNMLVNANKKQMNEAVKQFGIDIAGHKGIGLVFYAGHGIQSKGENYLIPIDASIYGEEDLQYECVNVNQMLAKMDVAKNSMNIIMLDACRNNPFERSWNRSTNGNGLASLNAPEGTIISFSTNPGNVASDGSGYNSPYTTALLSQLKKPSLTIEQVLKGVAGDVKKSIPTQMPWYSSSITGEFYFRP